MQANNNKKNKKKMTMTNKKANACQCYENIPFKYF